MLRTIRAALLVLALAPAGALANTGVAFVHGTGKQTNALADYWTSAFVNSVRQGLPNSANHVVVNCDFTQYMWDSRAAGCLAGQLHSFINTRNITDLVVITHSNGGNVMRWIMSYSWGTALASYMLLIGYISRDVKRRNMSAGVWMLMVLLMPAGIGAVVYFLLRQPVMTRCPSCRTELAHGFHFCPQCQFQMAPVCGKCFRGVHITDVYCVQCGHDLAEDTTPARLRSYSD